MKKWMQKSLMIAVAFLTLGLITPAHEIWDHLDQPKPKNSEVGSNTLTQTIELVSTPEHLEVIPETIDTRSTLLMAAKEQSYIKFGMRIAPKISDEFDQYIYPKMQEAIDMTLARLDDGTAKSLVVSEKPSGDYAEKIFNIYNVANGQDMIRFHVRTENRPFDGYYYNFHYHTADDEFVTHYDLGEIYWSKDTPPKWLS